MKIQFNFRYLPILKFNLYRKLKITDYYFYEKTTFEYNEKFFLDSVI